MCVCERVRVREREREREFFKKGHSRVIPLCIFLSYGLLQDFWYVFLALWLLRMKKERGEMRMTELTFQSEIKFIASHHSQLFVSKACLYKKSSLIAQDNHSEEKHDLLSNCQV